MFVAIMIIILGACAAIVWSMYFNTISMQKTYGAVNWYYWAYYWAMASVERWLLMSKIKYPTYEWSGWFKWDTIYWAASNWFAEDFWKLTQWNNSLTWNINSKTQRIVWVIDTKTLRSISFKKYYDANPNDFSTWREDGTYWIKEGLQFSGGIVAWSPNIWAINKNIWGSADFNRFFSLKTSKYIVRGLKTTDTYGRYIWEWNQNYNEENQWEENSYEWEWEIPYDREWEKDFQLTWGFNFTKESCNPRPALSWELDENYENINGCS